MNQIKTIALAGAFGIIGLACGWAAPASAQAWVDYKTGELVPAVTPADRHGFIAEAYGDVLGRPAGEENGLIGLLNQENTGRKAGGMPTDQMPTDQRGSFVNDAYGDVLGRDTGRGGANMQDVNFVPAVQNDINFVPAVQKDINFVPAVQNDINFVPAVQNDTNFVPAVQKGGSLGSLASVGSVGDLFALGRPGVGGGSDKALLPAVRPGSDKALNFSNPDALKGPNVAQTGGAVLGGGPHVNPGAPKGINFSNAGGQAGGGQINPGAVKGLNFTNTARK